MTPARAGPTLLRSVAAGPAAMPRPPVPERGPDMKRFFLITSLLLLLLTVAFAGSFERTLESRWDGAWVVTHVETRSDCAPDRANRNRVRAGLVRGDGRHRFPSGELARVESVKVERSQVAFTLGLAEPVLVPLSDGPYTMFRESRCRMTFEVEFPRDLGKSRDVKGIETALTAALERHGSAEGARRARAYNRRKRDPYPAGYERTLIEYAAWKADRLNEKTLERLDRVLEKTSRAAQRMSNDPAYLAGYSEGARAARSMNVPGCRELQKMNFEASARKSAERYVKKGGAKSGPPRDGYEDGHLVTYGLELARRLRGCVVPASKALAAMPKPAE